MNAKALSGSRVVLLLCGSFNPPTFLHLRMFERARDFLQQECQCRVLEGLISPVSDLFGKPALLAARHRLQMARLAVQCSDWISVDGWECAQRSWSRTVEVLRHHRHALRRKYSDDGLRLIMLCGGDTVESFVRTDPSCPDGGRLWRQSHLEEIFENFGVLVIQRDGANPSEALASPELAFLNPLMHTVAIIDDIPNGMSSTRLRHALRLGQSIRYCTPDSVVQYIHEHRLYADDDDGAAQKTICNNNVDVDDGGRSRN